MFGIPPGHKGASMSNGSGCFSATQTWFGDEKDLERDGAGMLARTPAGRCATMTSSSAGSGGTGFLCGGMLRRLVDDDDASDVGGMADALRLNVSDVSNVSDAIDMAGTLAKQKERCGGEERRKRHCSSRGIICDRNDGHGRPLASGRWPRWRCGCAAARTMVDAPVLRKQRSAADHEVCSRPAGDSLSERYHGDVVVSGPRETCAQKPVRSLLSHPKGAARATP